MFYVTTRLSPMKQVCRTQDGIHRAVPIADSRTHTHTGEPQYLSSKAPHKPHRGVPYLVFTFHSHIFKQYLVIKARVIYHSSATASREEASHTLLPRRAPSNASVQITPDVTSLVSINRMPQSAPLFGARYDRSRTTHHQYPREVK